MKKIKIKQRILFLLISLEGLATMPVSGRALSLWLPLAIKDLV